MIDSWKDVIVWLGTAMLIGGLIILGARQSHAESMRKLELEHNKGCRCMEAK